MSIYDQLYGIPAIGQPNPLDQQQGAYTPQGVVPDSLYQGAMNTAQGTPSPISQLSPLESQLSSLMNNQQGMMEALGYSPTEIAMINQAPTPDAANEVRNFIAQRQAGQQAQADQYGQQQYLQAQKIGSEEKQSSADIASREKIAQAELNQRNQAARADQLGEWLKSRAAMGNPPTPAEMDAFNKYLEKAFPTSNTQITQQNGSFTNVPTSTTGGGSQIKTKTVNGKTVYYNEAAGNNTQAKDPSEDAAYKEVIDAMTAHKVAPNLVAQAIETHTGWSDKLKAAVRARFQKDYFAPKDQNAQAQDLHSSFDAYKKAQADAAKPLPAASGEAVGPYGLKIPGNVDPKAIAAQQAAQDQVKKVAADTAQRMLSSIPLDQLRAAIAAGKMDNEPELRDILKYYLSPEQFTGRQGGGVF